VAAHRVSKQCHVESDERACDLAARPLGLGVGELAVLSFVSSSTSATIDTRPRKNA
jgi:hypothetical protein